MANPTWIVTVIGVATDGTNIFLEINIFNGTSTSQTLRPVFPATTSVSTITTYLQNIANAKPVLAANMAALLGTTYSAGS